MLWKQSMVERIFEEVGVEDMIQLFFRPSWREVKEKLQRQQVNKAYNKKVQERMKQFHGFKIWKKRKRK